MLFYISGNKVILSPGINGILPVEYFCLVKTSKNVILYQQNYDFVVYFQFNNNANEIENILVMDVKNEAVIKELNFSDLTNREEDIRKLDILIDFLIEQKLFKEKIIITFSLNRMDNYNNIISKNLKNLRYKSFFMIYIPLDEEDSVIQKNVIIHM